MKLPMMSDVIHLAIVKRQARTMDQDSAVTSYQRYQEVGYQLVKDGDYILVYTNGSPNMLVDAILVQHIQHLL